MSKITVDSERAITDGADFADQILHVKISFISQSAFMFGGIRYGFLLTSVQSLKLAVTGRKSQNVQL